MTTLLALIDPPWPSFEHLPIQALERYWPCLVIALLVHASPAARLHGRRLAPLPYLAWAALAQWRLVSSWGLAWTPRLWHDLFVNLWGLLLIALTTEMLRATKPQAPEEVGRLRGWAWAAICVAPCVDLCLLLWAASPMPGL